MHLERLSIGYKSSAPIVTSIDAELLPATFTCLIGRNGTGKSTLLLTLAGQLTPLHGHIIYNKEEQHPALVLPKMPELTNTTVRELVAYGRLPYTGLFGKLNISDYEAADAAIERLGINSIASKYTHQISDGERQKALIARGLAQGSSILLLDEPSAFLDYPSRRQLMEQLQLLAHSEGKIILLSTHDVELATNYADKLWLIQDQKLIEKAPQDFSPAEL